MLFSKLKILQYRNFVFKFLDRRTSENTRSSIIEKFIVYSYENSSQIYFISIITERQRLRLNRKSEDQHLNFKVKRSCYGGSPISTFFEVDFQGTFERSLAEKAASILTL